MTHATRFVASVAVLVALAACAPEIDAVRTRADQGDADAQFSLGVMYADGEGVPEDDTEAVRWFRLAADQGDTQAQYSLALMYGNGRGVTQDDVQAHMWFNLVASRAAGRAREMAVEDRDLVAGRMTADQLADAQRLAREWEAAHPR